MNKQKLLKRVLSAIFAVSVGMSNVAVNFNYNNIVEVSANSSVDFTLDYTSTVDSEYPQIENGILTLKDFTFNTTANVGIIVPVGTTIEFSGENEITSNGIGIKCAYDENILGSGDIVIEGASRSSLTINSKTYGIYVENTGLQLTDADLTISGETGIYMTHDGSTNYTFDIDDSIIDIDATSDGIRLHRILGKSLWEDSEININAEKYGLHVDGLGENGFIDTLAIDDCLINIKAKGDSSIYLRDVNNFQVSGCDEFNLSGADDGIHSIGASMTFDKNYINIEGNDIGIYSVENPVYTINENGNRLLQFSGGEAVLKGGTSALKTALDYGTSDNEIIFSGGVFPNVDGVSATFEKEDGFTQLYHDGDIATTIYINEDFEDDTNTNTEDDKSDEDETENDDIVVEDSNKSLYNITFKHNYPNDSTSDDFTKGTDSDGWLLKSDFYTPTYDGYTFLGWYLGTGSNDPKVSDGYEFRNSTEVYAVWEKINPAVDAQIHFNANGGTISTSSSTVSSTTLYTNSDGKISLLPNASRENYTFLGWYNGDTKVTTSTVYDKDTYLTAKWQETIYITFDYGYDGQSSVKKTIGSDGLIIGGFPTVDNRPNHQFLGWYTSDDKKIVEKDGYDFSQSQTLTGKWTESYTVTFVPVLNLLEPPTQQTDADGKLTSLPKMICPGYGLLGWYTSEEDGTEITTSTVFTTDTTIYARWIADEFTITFKPDYLGSVEFTMATSDYKITKLPDSPARSGYVFEGWYTKQNGDGTKLTDGYEFDEDTIVYGLWADFDDKYDESYNSGGFETETGVVTVSLDGQHEQHNDISDTKTNSYGRLTKYPGILVANGMAFDGWYTGKDGTGEKIYEDTKFLNDTTIYGNWIEGEVTVTINQEYDGSFEIPYATSNNRLSTLPAPKVRPGYTFSGWYWVSNSSGSTDATLRNMSISMVDILKSTTDTLEQAVTTSTTFTSDATIYARWTEIDGGTIIVSFDSNGGTPGYYIDQTGVDGRLNALPTPKREGYTFLGWYDGTLEISTSYIFRFDTEVYAKWQLDSEYQTEQEGNPGWGGNVTYTRDIPTLERLYIDKFQNLLVGDYITGLGNVSPNRPDLGIFMGWYHGSDLSRPLDYFELQSILVTEELFSTGIYPKFQKNIVSTGSSSTGSTSGGNTPTQVPVTNVTQLSKLF